MPRKKKEELPQIGDFCFLITDRERRLRQVVGVKFSENEAKYKLACGTEKTWHYLIEMTGKGLERTKVNGFDYGSDSHKQARPARATKRDKGAA